MSSGCELLSHSGAWISLGLPGKCLKRTDRIILNLLKPVVFTAADSGGTKYPSGCIVGGV